ncbi:MAG: P-II family nitrogen regulator [Deltaproteobacteria bacterium]|jgi:nitrogen regulatory protein PII 2|nr:P-II family nitrogen regulator [Deltaproteobacteria bacterium]
MRDLMAIVRTSKVGQTKNALAAAGFAGFTCAPCLGRGKKLIDPGVLKLIIDSGELPLTAVGESMTEASRLIPKRLFHIIVEDDRVQDAIDVLVAVNSTGHPGDGKIFVLPISAAFSVRLGQECGVS